MTDGKQKWVYAFEEGDGRNKMLLGGKGANLCEMTRIGLNVPPGFVITTDGCLAYLADGQRRLPDGAMDEVRTHMAALERKSGKRFGGGDRRSQGPPVEYQGNTPYDGRFVFIRLRYATGGGFGGCIVAVLPEPLVDTARAAIESQYRAPSGEAASIWVCHACEGAGVL